MTQIEVNSFLKFQKNDIYLNNFLKEGEICFNTIDFFRDIETLGAEIGDVNECISEIIQGELSLKLNDNIIATAKNGQLNIIDNDNIGNIFSLYTVYQDDVIKDINENVVFYFNKYADKRMFELSNNYVIIHDPEEFINRLDSTLKKLNYEFDRDFVKYYNNKVKNGHLDNFHKSDKYSYQQEYRYIIKNNNERIIIKIGNIEDIAKKVNFIDNLKFSYK